MGGGMQERRRVMDGEMEALRGEVAELKKAVADRVDAWRAAKGFLAFIKWTAGLVSAVAIIWATLHGGSPK